MKSWFTDVVRFHHKMERPIAAGFATKVMKRRRRLINEEFNELCRAMRDAEYANWHYRGWPPSQEAAHREVCAELIDLIYVCVGTFVEFGIDPQPVWNAIHAANMEKAPAPDGGEKAVKPKGWKKPAFALRSFVGVIPLIVGSSRSRVATSSRHPLDRTAAVSAPPLVDAISKQSVPKPASPLPFEQPRANRVDRHGLAKP